MPTAILMTSPAISTMPSDLQVSRRIVSSAKGQFLQSLNSHWLIASEKLVSEAYGLFADPADSFNLVVDENGVQGGASAYVQSSWNVPSYESQVIKLHFDLPDFNGSFLVGQSNIDLTVAKHLTVALFAQNTYMGDLAGGDPSRDMTWFVEGLGKFITGNDGYTKTAIDSLGLAALLPKTGQGWMGTNDVSVAGYLAVKYLDKQIRSSGAPQLMDVNASEGIKHLTTWMKTQLMPMRGHRVAD